MAHPSIERSEILIFQQGDTSIYHTQANVNVLDNSKGGKRLFIPASIFFPLLLFFFFVNKFLLNRENIYVNVPLEL